MGVNPILVRAAAAVRRAECRYLRHRGWGPDEGDVWVTSAPRFSCYAPSEITPFLKAVDESRVDTNCDFADLGSGFGRICFAGSQRFRRVVGFELDPDLFVAACEINKKLGLANVGFRQEDFLSADLKGFGAVYAFEPFEENFVPLIRERLINTPSGTVIITLNRICDMKEIFLGNRFRRLYPDRRIIRAESDLENVLFFVHVRK